MTPRSQMTSDEMRALVRKILTRFTAFPLCLLLLTLVPAGTLRYWQVYLYTAVVTVPMLCVVGYFLRVDPRFLERRTRAREKEKTQVAIQLTFLATFVLGFVVPGLDRRFGWSDVAPQLVIATDAAILLGYGFIFLVFRQNSYASRVVEVDKGQQVVSSGLYAVVRHPMYVGMLVMFLPTPLALGSYWGLIPMGFILPALVLRILNEEQVLRRDLPGYAQYCAKTRYRLLPFVW